MLTKNPALKAGLELPPPQKRLMPNKKTLDITALKALITLPSMTRMEHIPWSFFCQEFI